MRKGRLSLTTVVILFLLLPTWVRAESPSDKYEQAKAMSQSDGVAPGGAAYLTSIEKDIGALINKAFKQCLKRSMFSRPKLFNMVLGLDANGAIALVAVSEEQEASQCTREHLEGKTLPRPPFAPFHILVDVVPKRV